MIPDIKTKRNYLKIERTETGNWVLHWRTGWLRGKFILLSFSRHLVVTSILNFIKSFQWSLLLEKKLHMLKFSKFCWTKMGHDVIFKKLLIVILILELLIILKQWEYKWYKTFSEFGLKKLATLIFIKGFIF